MKEQSALPHFTRNQNESGVLVGSPLAAEVGDSRAFGIYIHTPYCVHRCSYCDFYSTVGYRSSDFEPVIDRICEEIQAGYAWWKEQGRRRVSVSSVFFGGGTPSLFPPRLIGRVIDTLDATFGLSAHPELTLEANPETVTPDFARSLRTDSRINRVSLGVQSFDPRFLSLLERRVTPDAVFRAFDYLRAEGFSNLSLDLIFGIPGQDLDAMSKDLLHAFEIDPPHISFYNLTLKPGHRLYRDLPDADQSAELYCEALSLFALSGYQRYEISNFAKPSFESRHNLLYWDGGEFLGVGPSASSRIFDGGLSLHRKQVSDTKSYVTRPQALAFQFESSSHYQTVLEGLFLELRKTAGIRLSRFRQHYHYDVACAAKLPLFESSGLLNLTDDRLALTERGLLLADSIAPDLLDLKPNGD